MKKDAMVAEATIGLKSGKVVHMRQSSDHMYSSIDLLSHRLKYRLNRLYEKEHDLAIKMQRRAKLAISNEHDMEGGYESDYQVSTIKLPVDIKLHLVDVDVDSFEQQGVEEEEEEEQGEDGKYDIRDSQQNNVDVELTVTKKKDFDLPPISVEEAVQALELMDHNFYMFRNQVSVPDCFSLPFQSTLLHIHLSTCTCLLF